jgi:DNA-directed RNA polymerase specialized sigma24 family protein
MLFYLLYRVITTDDFRVASQKWSEIEKVLRTYLMIRFKAQLCDAEDATQQTILALYSMVKDNEEAIYEKSDSYFLTVLRNEYFKIMKSRRSIFMESVDIYEDTSIMDTFSVLISKDEQRVLKECIDALPIKHREYIEYWIQRPEADSESFALEFDMSISNAWTIKHRLVQHLNKCVGIKMNEIKKREK